MKRSLLSLSVMIILSPGQLVAMESDLIYTPQHEAIFAVRFFDINDGPFMESWPAPLQSTWNMSQQQKNKLLDAMRYWATVITSPGMKALPAIINIGTYNEENAQGYSAAITSDGINSVTNLQAKLTGSDIEGLTFGSHAQFALGKMDFDNLPYIPSQLPGTGHTDLASVAIHELAHGLGITSDTEDRGKPGSLTPAFETDFPFGSWTRHLRDDNGSAARAGQVILCNGCNNRWVPQAFDVRQDKGYFTGEHVDEVLAGAMPGIPVKMLSVYGTVDTNYMSHIELKNSMMSHQNYRNYAVFMEAELAALQDMGYQIDRRNFFSFSVYGNGQTLINRHGYFLRNQRGDAYIAGEYNTALLGVGLHVYGSNNTLFQEASLLTKGDGAAGIRIDGENNTVYIEPGVQVYADGINGRGVMLAYGKNHNLINRGDIQALGDNGIALSFDFGNNQLGNDAEYRGSWIRYVESYTARLLPELQGALANNVIIGGRVAGKGAAIYISPNALVNTINIVKGAQLEGNIRSDYNQRDPCGQQRLTQLIFGHLADSNGQITDRPDSDFKFRYNGNIAGADNLALTFFGGETSLNGSHQIYSLAIAPGAMLSGNSDYVLNKQGVFINDGIVAPGNSYGQITVTGNYRQEKQGQLLLKTDGHGKHDLFTVNGQAHYDGLLTFIPEQDWYAPDWHQDSSQLLQATSSSGQFTVNSRLDSPTLTLLAVPNGPANWQLSMQRAVNAYSQYAGNSNTRQVGQALDRIVPVAHQDIQPLYRILDFSAADGSLIGHTLDQLSPSGYSATVASSLRREQQIADIISARLPVPSPALLAGEWQSFAVPFGGGFWQQKQRNGVSYNASSYGIVFGAEKQSEALRFWQFGFHGAVSGQSVSLKSPQNGTGSTTAFDLGLQARFAADPLSGPYAFGNGRFGIEEGKQDRSIAVNDYRAKHHASWKGLSAAVMAGGGYRLALGERLSAGPIASLEYTAFHRGSLTETGAGGSRLSLDSATMNSLRSSLGVKSQWMLPTSSDSGFVADLQLSWKHELRSTDIVQNARFTRYSDVNFTSKDNVTARNLLGIGAGVSYQFKRNLELSTSLASEAGRAGYRSLSGDLSAAWRF